MTTDLSTVQTLPELFELSVRRFPSNPLVREKRGEVYRDFTFNQIRDVVHHCAAGFVDLGLNKGDRVALISEGRKEWVCAELGILYAGGVNVPISVKIDELSELKFRLTHAGCRMVVVSGSQAHKVRALQSDLPDLETVIVLDHPAEFPDKTIAFDWLLDRGIKWLSAHGTDRLNDTWGSLKGSDLANICYTSGTTADPKGIMLTHRNYAANIAQSLFLYPLEPTATTLLILPWDHAFAHTCGIYALAACGGSFACIQLGKSTIETIRNIPLNIREVRPTFLMSVPALAKNFRKGIEKGVQEKGGVAGTLFKAAMAVAYRRHGFTASRIPGFILRALNGIFEAIIFKKIRLNFGGRLEYFIGGGALLDVELQRFFYAVGMPMFQGYGLTEAAPVISSNTPRNHRLGSSGKLVPDLELKICNEQGESLPVGEQGEIVVKGENVMAGYWKNEKATTETVRDGWLYTGDLGYMSDDGYLYVLGREKSLLISHDGEKFSPEGIEETVVENSPFIDQLMLHNNQSPYTVGLVVPNRDALLAWMNRHGHRPETTGGQDAVLGLLASEIEQYRPGGPQGGMFPERWLPSALAVLEEPFTEQNRFLNSTLKMVRGRIEKHYASRIAELHRAEGQKICNPKNREVIASWDSSSDRTQ